MVSDVTALSVGTEAAVQKKPTKKWNAAQRELSAAKPKKPITVKPAKDHNEIPKTDLTEPPKIEEIDNKHPKDERNRERINREQVSSVVKTKGAKLVTEVNETK